MERSRDIGGVRSVVLLPVESGGVTPSLASTRGLEVELLYDLSSYTHKVSDVDGALLGEHTLKIATSIECDLFESEILSRGVVDGVAARVVLASGVVLLLGAEGCEMPLRLIERSTLSGETPQDRPRREWTFMCYSKP
ncbi:MAG: hypothetical protein SNH13_00430 [Rikenellaceae bacterium]